MGPAQAIKTCLVKSFQYSGRASRSEFWLFGLFCLILGRYVVQGEFFLWMTGWLNEADISFPTLEKMHSFANFTRELIKFLTIPVGYNPQGNTQIGTIWMGNWTFLFAPRPYLGTILFLALIIPTISVAARRVRDAGWSPALILMLWLWPMALLAVSNSVVTVAHMLGGTASPFFTSYTQNVIGPFISHVAQILGEMTDLFAVYVFASPSAPTPSPNPSEAQK